MAFFMAKYPHKQNLGSLEHPHVIVGAPVVDWPGPGHK